MQNSENIEQSTQFQNINADITVNKINTVTVGKVEFIQHESQTIEGSSNEAN